MSELYIDDSRFCRSFRRQHVVECLARIVWSGELHDDERVGPTAAIGSCITALSEAASCEASSEYDPSIFAAFRLSYIVSTGFLYASTSMDGATSRDVTNSDCMDSKCLWTIIEIHAMRVIPMSISTFLN